MPQRDWAHSNKKTHILHKFNTGAGQSSTPTVSCGCGNDLQWKHCSRLFQYHAFHCFSIPVHHIRTTLADSSAPKVSNIDKPCTETKLESQAIVVFLSYLIVLARVGRKQEIGGRQLSFVRSCHMLVHVHRICRSALKHGKMSPCCAPFQLNVKQQ